MSRRIVISEFMDETAVDALRRDFEVQYAPDLVDRPADLVEALRGADALIVRNGTQVNGELMAGASRIAYGPMLPPAHGAWRDAERCEELDYLFRNADIVSLHVPYTPQNDGLVDERRLSLMRKGAVLVNTARGGIVHESALASALRSGALAGAAIDVFEQEPLPAGSVLDGCPNLFLTPHIAGVTHESNERVSALIAQRIAEVLRQA